MTREEYQAALKQAARYSDEYYNHDAPSVTDYEYDQLTQSIKKTEQEHPDWVEKESPTQHVGGKASAALNKVTHRVPLLSLNDLFSSDEVDAWLENMRAPETVVEQKIDGLSTEICLSGFETSLGAEKDSKPHHYAKLIAASTRGDGYVGEDCTGNAAYVGDVPAMIELPEGVAEKNLLIVRCEVYQPVAEFDRVNAEMEAAGKDLFSNPRNCAAGSLRAKDPLVTKSRGLYAIAFAILYQEGWDNVSDDLRPMQNQLTDVHLLNTLGFRGVSQILCHSKDDVHKAIETIGSQREGLPYWIDGAVIKINDRALSESKGYTAKLPLGQTAYKYPPEERDVEVLNIVVKVGRTGVITPVAEFSSVQLCGTSVTHATLHNQGYIDQKMINIGCTIRIIKSGEVIPKCTAVPKPADTPFHISHCPACGAESVVSAEGIASCPNVACPAKAARYVEYFCSKDVMDIAGLGPAVVAKLMGAGLITKVTDIYRLATHADELMKLDKMGEKSVNALLSAIESSKSQDMDRVIKSLGIPGVGRHLGGILAKAYPSIREVMDASIEALSSLPDSGTITAEAIHSFFENEENRHTVDELEVLGVNIKSSTFGKKESGGAFTSLTFVITGTFPTMGRDEAKAIIEAAGGKVSGSVSKKTDYLLAGEAAGGKLEKAQELGIKILSEEEFNSMRS